MRFSNRTATAVLLALGCGFALANVWYAWSRTLIPVAVDGRVASTEIRHEKHPGHDDIALIHLAGGRELVVEPAVAALVTTGARIEKAAWADKLEVEGASVQLASSADLRGMLWVQPIAALLVVVLAMLTFRTSKSPDSSQP